MDALAPTVFVITGLDPVILLRKALRP